MKIIELYSRNFDKQHERNTKLLMIDSISSYKIWIILWQLSPLNRNDDFIIIIIIIKLCWSHWVLLFSLVICPYQPLLQISLLDCILCRHRVFAGWPPMVRPCVRINWKMSLISLFWLLQQYLACLVHLT